MRNGFVMREDLFGKNLELCLQDRGLKVGLAHLRNQSVYRTVRIAGVAGDSSFRRSVRFDPITTSEAMRPNKVLRVHPTRG
jgi:hypothetical protein